MRKLHKVTTLEKPIPIARDKQCPCEVCALTKIRKMRGKGTERKKSVLELVSIDVCGPFERSRNGERYFLHIVDNYSRKCWTHPIQTRDQAPGHLETWKLKVELDTGLKLKAVRLDNAPELMKLLRQWEKDLGISTNPTEME